MSFNKKVLALIISMSIIVAVGCGENKGSNKSSGKEKKDLKKTVSLENQKICPVMGGEIDKSIAPVVKNGQKIYMCCEHCRKEMTDEFEENVEKLKALGQKPESL